jgi:hypothetical protein
LPAFGVGLSRRLGWSQKDEKYRDWTGEDLTGKHRELKGKVFAEAAIK